MEGLKLEDTLPPSAEADVVSLYNAVTEDPVPRKVHQFYSVKIYPYEDLNLPAAEKLITELDRQQELILEKIRAKSNGLGYWDWRWKWNYLRLLQLSLDKLQFANNLTRGRAIKPSSSVKEIDHHSLHFGLLHGSSNLSDEKKILRKLKETKKVSGECSTMADDKTKIYHLIWQTEEDIASASLHGELWRSLGSKESLIQQIKSIREELDLKREKQLELYPRVKVNENKAKRLEKQLESIGKLKDEATECISQWRKQQKKKIDACYKQYVSLTRHTRFLAKKKQVTALQKLSLEEVEKFMSQWNNDKAFRDDYQRRSVQSLNKRCLSTDGRTRNRDEKPISVKALAIQISKSLRKALQKKAAK